MKEKLKKYGIYLVPSLIVICILLILFAIKGIYPLGSMTIANADMGQSYMTFYHHLYDIFHSDSNVIYSYLLGSGSNILGGEIFDGFCSPISWLIALTNRENIANFFSILMMIRLALIAFTSFFCFQKLFPNTKKFWTISFSVMYALSGYVLSSYTNIMWLDNLILFPLFIVAMKKLFDENKIFWYIILLALNLVIGFYISYMILFFILTCGTIGILFYAKKENRKKICCNLIFATIAALCLSMFSFLPAFSQSMSSYRMSGAITNEVTNESFFTKISFFFFSAIAVLGFLKLMKHYKEDKKNVSLFFYSFLVTGIIPVLIERTNLLWHTGSYSSFPFRFGFIPIFILFCSALYYFSKYEEKDRKKLNDFKIIMGLIVYTMAVVLAVCFAVSINQCNPAFGVEPDKCLLFFITFMLFAFVNNTILKIEKEKLRYLLIAGVILTEIGIYSYGYIGIPEEYRGGTEHSADTMRTANTIISNLPVEGNSLYRYRDSQMLMTENYPLVTKTPSMSSWLHLISKEQRQTHKQMGYTTTFTKLGDQGGTIFSDALYHVKYIFSKTELEKEIYNLVGKAEDIYLYEYQQNLPIGLIVENQNLSETIPEEYNPFEAQNYVYRKLFDHQDDILTILPEQSKKYSKAEKSLTYEIDVKEKQMIYLYCNRDEMDHLVVIKVNGKTLNIPTIGNYDNDKYPEKFANGILNLGLFENEKVTVEIKMEESDANKVTLALLDFEKYQKLFENQSQQASIEVKGNTITITANTTKENTSIYLPITYDKGWSAKESGEEIQLNRAFNTNIEIPLKVGENKIELTFLSPNLLIGIKISIITAIVLILLFIINHKWKIVNCKAVQYIGTTIYVVIIIGFLLKVYIIPMIQTILSIF